MDSFKEVLNDGSILKLGYIGEKDDINRLDFKTEQHQWKDDSNAIFHYKTWIICFSQNALTSPELLENNDNYEEDMNMCHMCHGTSHVKIDETKKVGWKRKGKKYIFDQDVLDHFKNHYQCEDIIMTNCDDIENKIKMKSKTYHENNKNICKNETKDSNPDEFFDCNDEIDDEFKKIIQDDEKGEFMVVSVGNTYNINNGKPFELHLGRKFTAFAFEKCIQTMKIGETSLFLCIPHTMMGYNQMEIILQHINYKTKILNNNKNIYDPKNVDISQELNDYKNLLLKKYHVLTEANLVFLLEIKLLDIQEPGTFNKFVWEMNDEEKYHRATSLKNEGNHLFKSCEFNKASVKFQEALSIFQTMLHSGNLLNETFNRQCTVKDDADEDEEKLKNKLLELKNDKKNNNNEDLSYSLDNILSLSNICRLNYSACQLKLKNYSSVIENCTEVLKYDPENIKAYFRRGKAYSMINSYLDLAKKDFYRLKEIYLKYLEKEKDFPTLHSSISNSNGNDKSNNSSLPKLDYKIEIKNLNNEIKLLEKKIKQQNAHEKSLYSKIFSES